MDNRKQQESAACFAEVWKPSGGSAQVSNRNAADPRIMICWQGAKIYLPDNFQPEALLNLLRVLKQL